MIKKNKGSSYDSGGTEVAILMASTLPFIAIDLTPTILYMLWLCNYERKKILWTAVHF